MKTVTQEKLDEIRGHAQSICDACKDSPPENLMSVFNGVNRLTELAHEAGVASKDLMAKNGIWPGREAVKNSTGLNITRDPRFLDIRYGHSIRSYTPTACRRMFTQAARHIVINIDLIEGAAKNPGMYEDDPFFIDPYKQNRKKGQRPVAKGDHIQWLPVRLAAPS